MAHRQNPVFTLWKVDILTLEMYLCPIFSDVQKYSRWTLWYHDIYNTVKSHKNEGSTDLRKARCDINGRNKASLSPETAATAVCSHWQPVTHFPPKKQQAMMELLACVHVRLQNAPFTWKRTESSTQTDQRWFMSLQFFPLKPQAAKEGTWSLFQAEFSTSPEICLL